MAWRIEFNPRALDELAGLDQQVQRRILKFLRERVAPLEDPLAIGEALTGGMKGLWKHRVGPCRLIGDIQGQMCGSWRSESATGGVCAAERTEAKR